MNNLQSIILPFIGNFWYQYPEVLMIAILIFFITMFIVLLPKPIDVVYNKDKSKKLFKIYTQVSGFRVKDYSSSFSRRSIYFRSYVDVEAYIKRRINGWHTNINT